MSKERYVPNATGRKECDGFVTSSFTFLKAPSCVAVRRGGQVVEVRDTKDTKDTTLTFTPTEWRAFIQGVKNGEFDV